MSDTENTQFKELVEEFSDINELRTEAMARMEEAGLVIFLPDANEIQIDIDNEYDLEVYHTNMHLLGQYFDSIAGFEYKVIMTKSRNKEHGYHARVYLPFIVSETERIAFQAFLGSDRKRELLSYIRMMKGDDFPCLLAETQETASYIKAKRKEFIYYKGE